MSRICLQPGQPPGLPKESIQRDNSTTQHNKKAAFRKNDFDGLVHPGHDVHRIRRAHVRIKNSIFAFRYRWNDWRARLWLCLVGGWCSVVTQWCFRWPDSHTWHRGFWCSHSVSIPNAIPVGVTIEMSVIGGGGGVGVMTVLDLMVRICVVRLILML